MNNPTYVKIVFWTITNKYRILYLSFSRADAQHLEYNQNCATVVKLTWLKISYVKAWWVSEIIYTLIKYIHVYKRFIRTTFPDSCIKPAHKLPENSSFAPKSLSSDKWLLPFNRASSLIHINLLIHFWLCKYSVFIQPRILCRRWKTHLIRLSSLWWCKENRFW